MRASIVIGAALVLTAAIVSNAVFAQENYDSWEPIKPLFESTGGGGVMIGGYNPVVAGAKCATDFSTHEPNGNVSWASVEFDAVPTQGGVLCVNGKWRTKDGGASGTTPFRVFIKDGVKRGSPIER